MPVNGKIVGQKEINGNMFYVVKRPDGTTYLEPKKEKKVKKKLKLVRKR